MQRRFLLIFAKIMAYDFNVVTSIQAEEDLRGIFEYITFELLSPEMQAKIGRPYLSGLPCYKRTVWFEMKRL